MTEPKHLPLLRAVVSVSLAVHGSVVEEFGGQLVNDTVHLAIWAKTEGTRPSFFPEPDCKINKLQGQEAPNIVGDVGSQCNKKKEQ